MVRCNRHWCLFLPQQKLLNSSKKTENLLLPPSFEGYKAACATRRNRGDEPPHHSRPGRGSSHPHPRQWRRLRTLHSTRAAASQEPDTAHGQRQRCGVEHADGGHGQLAGEGLEVRVPVASV